METESTVCAYNKSIDCANHAVCTKCGWNPTVSKNRVKRLRKQLRFPTCHMKIDWARKQLQI